MWYDEQRPEIQAIIDSRLLRVRRGNFGDCSGKAMDGVWELKIDHGPAYRIYFGKENTSCIVLLGGGLKKHQQNDIDNAKANWKDYKRRRQDGLRR